MKVIITYDISILRVNSVRQLLKQYLSWIQNSVFEGELSIGNLKELQLKLANIVDLNEDSIIVYTVNNPAWIEKTIIGLEKGNTSNIL